MWTHRRFTWRYVPEKPVDLDPLVLQVADVLGSLCADTPQFFRDPLIQGMSFGILEFQVTISDRDRWWVARRARFLMDALRKQTQLPLRLVTEEQVKLVTHSNRGKYRLRRRRRENTGA